MSGYFTGCTPEKKETDSNENKNETKSEKPMKAQDVHSFSKPSEAVVKHLNLDIEVDFDNQIVKGTAHYEIENKEGVNKIFFDTRDLFIEAVKADSTETTFALAPNVKYLGQALEIDITPETKLVSITYQTKPEAAALQWLSAQQTAGKRHPFFFTQSQAILARTWLPCQDSPGVRMTYEATVKVPKDLMALMSAENPTEKSADGVYKFKMDQAIPSYLMALSVGNVTYKSVGAQTGVYAEPSVIGKAANEFAEMQQMLEAAEEMYGKYSWERYDVIVLPPSFPFGGMENPRLTFATPTILAGDRSLTALIAHELAHSWSGNLVTNATWEDFWLNEGFTVYFELRIVEEVYGKDYADMLALIGLQDLREEIKELKQEDTHLKLELDARDPDEGLTSIAYDKGYYFLRLIEENVGRERFDKFLNAYFSQFAFRSVTTEQFLEYLRTKLLDETEGLEAKIQPEKWIYGPGLPDNCPEVSSERYDAAVTAAEKFAGGTPASEIDTQDWKYQQWVFFLKGLDGKIDLAKLKELDKAFKLSKSGNNEILFVWLTHVAKLKYEKGYPTLKNFLMTVGRRKFIAPLYETMSKDEEMKAMAVDVYGKARSNYHYVAINTIDGILGYKAAE